MISSCRLSLFSLQLLIIALLLFATYLLLVLIAYQVVYDNAGGALQLQKQEIKTFKTFILSSTKI